MPTVDNERRQELLARVRETAIARNRAELEHYRAISAAADAGIARRAIAEEAGVTHGRVQQIVGPVELRRELLAARRAFATDASDETARRLTDAITAALSSNMPARQIADLAGMPLDGVEQPRAANMSALVWAWTKMADDQENR